MRSCSPRFKLPACPNFTPYTTANNAKNIVGGINRQYTGYGMNVFPKFDELATPVPPANFPPQYTDFDWDTFPTQDARKKWYQIGDFRKPAERALVADSYWWKAEAKNIDVSTSFIPGQKSVFDGGAYNTGPSVPGQSTLDFYRHGKYPEVDATGTKFKPTGGKVAYNVLFCDGHVVTMTDRESGYRSVRMRFPG